MKKAGLIKPIYSLCIILLFFSCEKEKTPEELISGTYSLEYASIDGEEVTDFLVNDSVGFYDLFATEVEGKRPFNFYFSHENYQGSFTFINDSELRISNKGWTGLPDSILLENIAFLPFAKQDEIFLNIETLSENQLVFNTFYLEKKYRYEFVE